MDTKNLDIYGDPPIPWSRALDLLEAAPQTETPRTTWLSPVRPDGGPHLVGVGALFVDGNFYFTSGPGTQKSRNLAANSNCALSTALPGLDLAVEGRAAEGDRPGDARATGSTVCGAGLARPRHQWCTHGRLQRAQRRASTMAPLRGGAARRIRGGDGKALRCYPLALLIGNGGHYPIALTTRSTCLRCGRS